MKNYSGLPEEEAKKSGSKFCFQPYMTFALGKAAAILLFFVILLFLNADRHIAVTGTCIAVIRFSIGDFIGRFIYGIYPLDSKKIVGALSKSFKLIQIGLYGVSWFAFMEAVMLLLGFGDRQLLVSIAVCLVLVSAIFMVMRIERDVQILTNVLKKHKIQSASAQKIKLAFAGSFFSLFTGVYAAAIMLLTRTAAYSVVGAVAVCIIVPAVLFFAEKLLPIKRRVKKKKSRRRQGKKNVKPVKFRRKAGNSSRRPAAGAARGTTDARRMAAGPARGTTDARRPAADARRKTAEQVFSERTKDMQRGR